MLILFFFLLETEATTYCNLCSDSNIETHFGVFFSNPRDLQEGFRKEILGCNSTDVAKQECSSTCFSLNVTSLHIKRVSYGCSSQMMPESLQKSPECTRKDIVLRTIPPYVVQAEYCSCKGSSCNHVTVLPSIKRTNNFYYQIASSVSPLPVISSLLLLSLLFR